MSTETVTMEKVGARLREALDDIEGVSTDLDVLKEKAQKAFDLLDENEEEWMDKRLEVVDQETRHFANVISQWEDVKKGLREARKILGEVLA